jgi:SAM-dependent methyltransferase
VTVFDNSPAQLSRDRLVAERENLDLRLIQGDMADLSVFPDESFDLVFHPVSNLFVPDLRPVWREASRVLRPGGALLSGFMNPVFYIFDWKLMEQGILEVRHKIPYSDLESLPEAELEEFLETGNPLEFGHSLEAQIGGQLEAGLLLAGFYEDRHTGAAISNYISTYIATRAIKPPR